MSISFSDAVGNLKSMFPEWDDEFLGDILMSNNYNIERSIETILSLDSSGKAEPESEMAPAAASASGVKGPHAAMLPQAAPAPRPLTRPPYRGKRVQLPDSFLRAPGGELKAVINQDEELARMLQNELFREEVKKNMGKGAIPGGGTDSKGRGSGGDEMLTAVSNMGSTAKKNLLSLADRFRSSMSGSKGIDLSSNSSGSDDSEYIFDNKSRGQQHLLEDGSDNPLLASNSQSEK